ncbi:hypothetical protein D3C87_2119770 [compost metagenome]
MGGTAKMMSQPRITISSSHPRCMATMTPTAEPTIAPIATARNEVESEFHAPTISIEATSRPN